MSAIQSSINNLLNAVAVETPTSGTGKRARDEFIDLLLSRSDSSEPASDTHTRNERPRPRKQEPSDVGLANPLPIYAEAPPPIPTAKEPQIDNPKVTPVKEAKENRDPQVADVKPVRVKDVQEEKPVRQIQPEKVVSAKDTVAQDRSDAASISDEVTSVTEALPVLDVSADDTVLATEQPTDINIIDTPASDTPAVVPPVLTLIQQVMQLISDFMKNLSAPPSGPEDTLFARIDRFLAQLNQLLHPTAPIAPQIAQPTQSVQPTDIIQPFLPVATASEPVKAELIPGAPSGIAPKTPIVISPAPIVAIAQAVAPKEAAEPQLPTIPIVNAQPVKAKFSPEALVKLEQLKFTLTAEVEKAKSELPKLQNPDAAIADEGKSVLLRQVAKIEEIVTQILERPQTVAVKAPQLEDAAIPISALATQPAVKLNTENAAASTSLANANVREAITPISSESGSKNSGGNTNQQAQSGIMIPANSGSSQTEKTEGASFTRMLDNSSKPIFEQVSFNVKTMIKDGSHKISIQLDPADLGKLEIKLHVAENGKTIVHVIADNKDTLEVLRRDTAGLERALSDAGLKTDTGSLNFNLRGQSEQGKEHSQASHRYLKASPDEDEALPENVINRSYVVNLAEGLDIKI
jgi:hypothetical protein